MTGLRWRYALRDLWLNKTRTVLVILSIAVGIFAFGIIAGAANTLWTELPVSYLAVHPASATLHTSLFDDDEVDAIARMADVAAAEGRHGAVVRFQLPSGDWHDLQLIAMDDYLGHEVDIVRPYIGTWPPPDREILIERNSLDIAGDIARRFSSRRRRRRSATVAAGRWSCPRHEPAAGPNHRCAVRLRHPRYHGVARAAARLQPDAACGQATSVRQGHTSSMLRTTPPTRWKTTATPSSGRKCPTPASTSSWTSLPTILLILTFLGTLALILSGFLVINVITAILTQQTRQIGVMKTVGAEPAQIAALYLRMVAVFGLCALILAIPLGFLGASVFSHFVAAQLNFDIERFRLSPGILALEILVGILAPIVAAILPIRRAALMTVREAVQERGLADVSGESRAAHNADPGAPTHVPAAEALAA